MKKALVCKSLIVASICALALAAAVGCSSGSSSSAASASSAAASSTASSAASSESASAETASSSATSSEAASSEATSSEATSASAAASSAAAQQSESASASSSQDKVEAAKTLGFQVFEGTVRVCDGAELIALQGKDIDPAAAGGGGTYAVLVFDQPTDVIGMSADGSGERTESSNMMGIAEFTDYGSFQVNYGDLDKCKTLDGQRVTIGAKASDIMFPSDVRLPIGEPSASKVEFL